MAKTKLTLMTLTCVKKQDTVGPDEVLVYVGDNKPVGPLKISKNGQGVYVGGSTEFDGEILITLKEQDKGGKDDVLGSWKAYASETDGIRRAHFHALSGADYHLLYDVDAV